VPEDKKQLRRDSHVRLSGGGKRLAALIFVLGVAAAVGVAVWRLEARSSSNADSALQAAEVRFEHASRNFENGIRHCGTGASRLRCSETHARAWGEAFEQLASSLSGFTFPASKAKQAAALVRDARQIGNDLLVASRAKTLNDYFSLFFTAQSRLPGFAQDAELLLGHGL
jgi:hypothetical protein